MLKILAEFIHLKRLLLLLLLSSGIILSSCNKFDGDITIPSYIQVDTVYFATDYAYQGENTHEITDLWVYVDDQQMGVFELPAKFPLLYQGTHKLEIRAGIKLNGISSTRAPNPMYKPIVFEDFEFHPDSVLKLNNLTFEYYSNVKFAWIENFESGNLTIEKTSSSDTIMMITSPANNPDAFLSPNSKYSGIVVLDDDKSYFNGWSYSSYVLPSSGVPIFLEMDFKTDNYMTVGMFVSYTGGYKSVPLVILNYSEEWNHIYINLTPTVAEYPTAINFKILFEAGLDSYLSSSKVYVDNIKLMYRDNS